MSGLEQEIIRWRNTGDKPRDIADRIERKYSMLRHSYAIEYDPIARVLQTDPTIFDQIDDLPNLRLFFRKPIEIAIALSDDLEVIWCSQDCDWVAAARYPGRLLIHNPISQKTESWARFSSDSKKDYTVHHVHAKGRKHKSKFDGGFGYIAPIELAILDQGIGLLVSIDKIRLYGKFEKAIGKAPNGAPLDLACLEITRERRRPTQRKSGKVAKQGFYLRGHGYPVGLTDIEQDFKGNNLQTNDLPVITESCLNEYLD